MFVMLRNGVAGVTEVGVTGVTRVGLTAGVHCGIPSMEKYSWLLQIIVCDSFSTKSNPFWVTNKVEVITKLSTLLLV